MRTRTIQLSRAKGSRRPPGVTVVDRSTPWGNRFRVGDPGGGWVTWDEIEDPAEAVETFEVWTRESSEAEAVWIREHVHELAGGTLGCWCLAGPCHAKTLARMADESAELKEETPDG